MTFKRIAWGLSDYCTRGSLAGYFTPHICIVLTFIASLIKPHSERDKGHRRTIWSHPYVDDKTVAKRQQGPATYLTFFLGLTMVKVLSVAGVKSQIASTCILAISHISLFKMVVFYFIVFPVS